MGAFSRAAVLFEAAHRDRLVHPGQGVVLELSGERSGGQVVFRRDDEAGGVPVDAVDDTRPQFPADAGEGIPAVVEQGVDQRAVRVAGGRVDHQPLGLFTTITSLSSYTTSRGMSWGATSTGSGSGRATDTASPPPGGSFSPGAFRQR